MMARARGGSPAALVMVALAVAAVAACKDKAPAAPDPVDPVSIDEARALARDFGAAMAPCDADRLGELFDSQNLLRRALHKTNASAEMKRGMERGMSRGSGIAMMLCQATGDDGLYQLLRVREVDGQPRPLFRLLVDDGLNYHELELGKSKKDGKVRVVDILVYASGDKLSDSLTQMLDQATAMAGGEAAEFARTARELKAAQQAGDLAEVRRLLPTLPAALRETKPMRLTELMASDVESPEYVAVMERYRRDFPDDPSLDVIAIDYHLLTGDVPATLAAIDKLDRRVGGDPYLAAMRAGAFLSVDPPDTTEAARWARQAVTDEPGLEAGWWALATALLTAGDHAAVLPVADTLRTKFQAPIDPVGQAGNPLWEAHFASEAYRTSTAGRGAATP